MHSSRAVVVIWLDLHRVSNSIMGTGLEATYLSQSARDRLEELAEACRIRNLELADGGLRVGRRRVVVDVGDGGEVVDGLMAGCRAFVAVLHSRAVVEGGVDVTGKAGHC